MSTGKLGWTRKSWTGRVRGFVPANWRISPNSTSHDQAERGIRPACGSTIITGRCAPGLPIPTHALRATASWQLKIASQGIVYIGAGGGQHTVCHAAAEPETALFVQIACVAHPMPDLRAVGDLAQPIGV